MTKKGGAPRKAPDGLTVALFFRVDDSLVARVDDAKDRRNAGSGPTWSRADVLRDLVTAGLDREEPSDGASDRFAESAPKKRKGAK